MARAQPDGAARLVAYLVARAGREAPAAPSLRAAHAAELPLSLYVRRTPGTLANRGILLATICEPGAALATVYVWRPESPSEQVEAWIEPSYADDPNTPCEITPEPLRRTRIVAGPTGRPIASAPLAPGGRATLVLADAP